METMEIRKKRRICLVVAYDGTNYQGWQIQQNGNTIEAELNRALSALTKEPIEVSGASRTDSGVHARCNYAVFDTAVRMPGDKFSYALNQRLPEDIRVRKSYEVSPHWHPRKCSSKKTYEYRIFNDEFPDPLCRLYTHFTYTKLDIDRMNAAAGYLIGEHDFKSFCNAVAEAFLFARSRFPVLMTHKAHTMLAQSFRGRRNQSGRVLPGYQSPSRLACGAAGTAARTNGSMCTGTAPAHRLCGHIYRAGAATLCFCTAGLSSDIGCNAAEYAANRRDISHPLQRLGAHPRKGAC
jgi:tRNA pseudouridine(38-40) synthase